MIEKVLAFSFLCMISHISVASIPEIEIFKTDTTSFVNDLDENIGITLTVFNLDDLTRAEQRLTLAVRKKLPNNVKASNVTAAYRNAFSEILNSTDWAIVNSDLRASTEPLEMAMRLTIKKVPAIVLNDKYIIYGVSSLKDAIEIYDRNGVF